MSDVNSELNTAIELLRNVVRPPAGIDDSTQEKIETFLDSMDEDVVRICRDDDCGSPREWDNVGVMFCRHPRHSLGDENAAKPIVEVQGVELDGHWMTEEQAEQALDIVTEMFETNGGKDSQVEEKMYAAVCFLEDPDNWMNRHVLRDDVAICLPIGMYEHSGITLFHGAPSGWDSGQVGWHYMTREVLDQGFGGDKDKAKACMESELKVYDQWLRGNCWSYVIEKRNGDCIDACSGFIGDKLESTGILEYVDSDYHEEAEEAWEHRFDAI